MPDHCFCLCATGGPGAFFTPCFLLDGGGIHHGRQRGSLYQHRSLRLLTHQKGLLSDHRRRRDGVEVVGGTTGCIEIEKFG